MKSLVNAILGMASLATAYPHVHQIFHRHVSDLKDVVSLAPREDIVTVTVAATTLYQFGDRFIDGAELQEGIKNGWYAVATYAYDPASTQAATTSLPQASVVSEEVRNTVVANLVPSVVTEEPELVENSSESKVPGTQPGSVDRVADVTVRLGADFPSGSIPCSTFPEEYGAVPIDWLQLEGWTGIQQVPGFEFGHSQSIGEIITTTAGNGGCVPNSFCSYACPPGYEKSQWPSAQGSTGQSIGGLWCNTAGMLELSRPAVPQLCAAGVGNIFVENRLNQNVAICRTDYPGSESQTVPLDTQPDQRYPMTCPDALKTYRHFGRSTTAQYYVNPAGTPVSTACQWGDGGNTGNWAPVNLGVGRSSTGMTYISIFPNAPTNTDGKLDFKITIAGDGISGDCSYESGKFWMNGVETPVGCTVSLTFSCITLLIAP